MYGKKEEEKAGIRIITGKKQEGRQYGGNLSSPASNDPVNPKTRNGEEGKSEGSWGMLLDEEKEETLKKRRTSNNQDNSSGGAHSGVGQDSTHSNSKAKGEGASAASSANAKSVSRGGAKSLTGAKKSNSMENLEKDSASGKESKPSQQAVLSQDEMNRLGIKAESLTGKKEPKKKEKGVLSLFKKFFK